MSDSNDPTDKIAQDEGLSGPEKELFDRLICHHLGSLLDSSLLNEGQAPAEQLELKETYTYHNAEFDRLLKQAGTNVTRALRHYFKAEIARLSS